MKLNNVLYKLYNQPWCILPSMHRTICDIVADHVSGRAHEAGGRAFMFDEPPASASKKPLYRNEDGVAVIDIDGVIATKVGMIEKSSGVYDLLDLQAALRAAIDDEQVRGIMLNIESPGGTVGRLQETADMIRAARDVKPVVAYTPELMASAAYWLGSQATAVYAAPTAEIGSIGVYQAVLDASRAYENEGYKVELFKTGVYKGAGYPGTSLSYEVKAKLQADVDRVFQFFTEAVDAGRGVDISDIYKQGQTVFAAEAVAANLIDAVGTYEQAKEELK
jgi:signal peptide peptidase SppA